MICVCVSADLGEDVLLSHEFLSLSVGCGGDHRQDVLTIVGYNTHKEYQVLQKLNNKPEMCIKTKITHYLITNALRLTHL